MASYLPIEDQVQNFHSSVETHRVTGALKPQSLPKPPRAALQRGSPPSPSIALQCGGALSPPAPLKNLSPPLKNIPLVRMKTELLPPALPHRLRNRPGRDLQVGGRGVAIVGGGGTWRRRDNPLGVQPALQLRGWRGERRRRRCRCRCRRCRRRRQNPPTPQPPNNQTTKGATTCPCSRTPPWLAAPSPASTFPATRPPRRGSTCSRVRPPG